MFADPGVEALVDNFFAQWHVACDRFGARRPIPTSFRFHENLRDAFERETKMFIESQLREDRSVLDL